MAVRYDAKAKKWVSDTRDAHGRRERRCFRTKNDAEQHEAAAKLRNPRSRNRPARSALTIQGWLAEWLRIREPEIAGSTARLYRTAVSRVTPIIGDLPLQSLNRGDVRACLLKLREDGLSEGTVGTTRNILKLAIRHAVAEELLATDPTIEPVQRRRRVVSRRVRALTVEQARAFVSELDQYTAHDRAAVLLLLFCGLRTGEALALRPDALDFAEGTVHVEGTVSREDGERMPKTAAGRRGVPIPDSLVALLRTLDLTGEFVLWPDTARDRAGVGRLQGRMTALVRGAGKRIGVTASPHDCRHTFCAQMVAAGVSLYAVSRWSGHTDIAFTVKTYGSWLRPEDSSAVERYASRLTTTAHTPVDSGSTTRHDSSDGTALSDT